MNVAVQGTKKFDDYSTFMRAMAVALLSCEDGIFHVYSAGPAVINSYTSEFCNISENGLARRGVKVKFFRVPPSYIETNIDDFDYVAFFSKPNERPSNIISIADSKGIENAIFRY